MSDGTPAHSVGRCRCTMAVSPRTSPFFSPPKDHLDKCEALSPLLYFEAKINATFAKVDARLDEHFATLEARLDKHFTTLEALRAWPRIASSVHIPSLTTMWMSLPTAAGSTLRIKEVCARQDAHFEASLADFRLFADNLDLRQPSMHASSVSLNDDDNDHDKDKAIPIVWSIDNADVEFKDITIVLAPPSPLPYMGAVVPFLGGGCPLLSPNMLPAFELATVPPQKAACQLKRPRCRPCRRNQPRAPNPLDKAIPSHPHPIMGGTSLLTKTLPATSARATTHRSMKPLLMSFAMTSSSSPSLQPFMLHKKGRIKMGERDAHQRKGMCCRIRPRRVGQQQCPWAPNPLDHLLCGGRHWPRASTQSTGWASA
jgi:hypothetical protein